MKRKILITTDFSDEAARAFRYAAGIYQGDSNDAFEAILLHVENPAYAVNPEMGVYVSTPPEVTMESRLIQKRMTEQVEKWSREFGGIQFITRSEIGPIVPVIREVAEEIHADLIVAGASGKGAIERSILGSVATDLAKHAPCPVLIVPAEANVSGVKRAVLATDFKNLQDTHILDPLQDIVHSHEASLMLLHIYQYEEKVMEKNFELLEELSDYFNEEKFEYYFLEDDDKLRSIEDFMVGYHADMLALIAQERSFFQDLFHRSLTRRLIIHSKVPVLILHPVFWGSDEDDEDSFNEKVARQVKNWRAEVDRLKMQSKLGQMEMSDNLERGTEEAKKKLNEVMERLDGAGEVAKDKWQNFQKEMTEALKHVKKALVGR